MQLVYVGPHTAIDIEDLANDFTLVEVENGKPVEIPEQTARSLLAQGPLHWRIHRNKPVTHSNKPASVPSAPPIVKRED